MRGMRDDLSEAMDALGDEETFAETRQEVLTDDEETVETDTDEQDSGDAEESPTESEGVEADGKTVSAESDPKAEAPSDPREANQSLKAPVGWAPKEREQWSKVPRPLQERILAREKEMAEGMANTKGAKAVENYVNRMGEHYGDLMQSAGFKHPLDAAGAAMGSMNVLATGTQDQKATELARIISQFGVDIEVLDNALVGGGSSNAQQDPQMQRIQQMLDERLAPVNQLMTRAQQMQEQQRQQQGSQAVEEVKKFGEQAEFLNDVREDMADIIELAEKRGQKLSLQQAYNRACAAHPEIANIIEQRRRDEQLKGGRAELDAKRTAASSISGRQGGSGGNPGNLTLRDTIAQAMDGDS